MRFNKTKKLLKKDEKELESNPLNDIYHALAPEERNEKKGPEQRLPNQPSVDASLLPSPELEPRAK